MKKIWLLWLALVIPSCHIHTNLGICASVVVGVHSLLVSVTALSPTWLQKKGPIPKDRPYHNIALITCA